MDQQDGSASSWPNLAEELDLDLDLNLDLDLCQPSNTTVQRVITVPSSVTASAITVPSNVTTNSAISVTSISNTSSTPTVNTTDFEANDNVTVLCKAEGEISSHTTVSSNIHQQASVQPSQTQNVVMSSTADTCTDTTATTQIGSPTKSTTIQLTGSTPAGQPVTYILPNNILSSLKSGKLQLQLPSSNAATAAVNVASINPATVPSGTATATQLKAPNTNVSLQSKSNYVPIAPANKPSTSSTTQIAKIFIPGTKSNSPQVIMIPAEVLSGNKGKQIQIQVPNSASNSTSGGGSGTLPLIAIGNNTRQVATSSSSTSTNKFVPIAPSPSVGKTTASTSSVTTAQIVSSKPGQPQVLMLSSNIFAQMKNNKIQIQVPSSAISTSGGSGTTNITLVSASGQKTNLSTPSRTNYVPIAPSPVTHSAIHNASSNVTSRDLFGGYIKGHQPNGSTSKAGILGVGGSSLPDDANRQRKPCNCTKSQCLKLYCDCFANGEFCSQCNCTNCYNNLDHEDERQRAVRQCLERNPQAFHPKIGKGRSSGDVTERRHTKGCNCRRSGCLKNYCECYEAKILCSELCKCCGCKNYEDSFERRSLQLMNPMDGESKHGLQAAAKLTSWTNDFVSKKYPFLFCILFFTSIFIIKSELVYYLLFTYQCWLLLLLLYRGLNYQFTLQINDFPILSHKKSLKQHLNV